MAPPPNYGGGAGGESLMKRHIWVPTAFFLVGLAFYVYYGITWNAWMKNLPNICIYAVIVVGLGWSLWKKDQYANNRKQPK